VCGAQHDGLQRRGARLPLADERRRAAAANQLTSTRSEEELQHA
jgi:hypothetical protein